MPCTPLPTPTLPSLPPGITLAPPLPALPSDLTLCCKLAAFPAVLPPLPFPVGVVNPALAAVIATQLALVREFLDGLPLKCPKDE